MNDVLFPNSDVMNLLVQLIGAFLGIGILVAFIGWVLGYVIWFIIDAMRY